MKGPMPDGGGGGDDNNHPSLSGNNMKGCLVVHSNDSDFCDLLETGRRRGLLVVSATPDGSQTAALERASDLVLKDGGRATPEAYSLKGVEFMPRIRGIVESWRWGRNDGI